MIGIRTAYKVSANVPFTTNVVLATVGLLAKLAANQIMKVRAWVPFSVGATGGVRAQWVLPAGATILSSSEINNTVAPLVTVAVQTTSVAITNALANAGNHWVLLEAYIKNGATAGNVDLQFAQNTSDALTLTILEGGNMEVLVEN